jgi:NTE family protein
LAGDDTLRYLSQLLTAMPTENTNNTDNASRQDFLQCAAPYSAKLSALAQKQYSDVLDDQGHQYIDLVLEGGGTLGIALLGYIYALETVGLRFIGIGGTSAGAISAIALGAAAAPNQSRLDALMDLLANMPMRSFVDGRKDGDDDAIEALEAWLKHRNAIVKTWKTAQVVDNLTSIHALNRGHVFREWMSELLKGFNSGQDMTVAALRQKMTTLPPLWVSDAALESDFSSLPVKPYTTLPDGRKQVNINKNKHPLCVIAADISTETKVEFPRMAQLYWPDAEQVNVADFARASMSIPGFFETFQLDSLPVDVARSRWSATLSHRPPESFEGNFLPKRHHFVDGGVLSNFPINAFHNATRVPLRPTFGVKLQWDVYQHDINNLMDVVMQTFNSARHALDNDFIFQNPDFKHLVAFIDTQDISWLDFGMRKETKLQLFEMGLKSAINFLEKFDWEDYKFIRRKLLEANLIRS